MQDFLIGRQQILDRDQNVYAYELLFRDVDGKGAAEFGLTEASNHVIVNTLLEQGLENVVGPYLAFINFTRDNLLANTGLLLPKDKVVIEVLENMEIDAALIAALRRLVNHGYALALDDFVFEEKWLPLIDLARFIKLDLRQSSPATNRALIGKLAGRPIRFIAEKVETPEEHAHYRALGCEYFQGFLFSRPHIIQGRRLTTSETSILRLLAALNDPRLSLAQLADLIAQDVGLSHKLLRYINSAAFSLGKTVDSIRQALSLLGLAQVRRWASLIVLARFPGKPRELLNVALVRAKMCETLVATSHPGQDGPAFLVGMLSAMDQLLDRSLEEALRDLPLSEPVRNALLLRRGIKGEALNCAVAYESWHLDAARFAGLPLARIGRIYQESVAWAYQAERVVEH